MTNCSWIDWQAVGSVATLIAVLVALWPIHSAHLSRKAKARNLRLRVASKLLRFRAALDAIAQPASKVSAHLALSETGFIELVTSIESLLSESDVLHPQEQDRISQALANLELAAPLVAAGNLSPSAADNLVALIDSALESLQKRALLSGRPEQPWLKK